MTDILPKDITELQDIEKIQFLQTLQANPAQYAAYISGKKESILSEVSGVKRATFLKTSADMARQMDMDNNSRLALERTSELSDSQEYILKQQRERVNVQTQNESMTRRQVEINNWYYEEKRERLFILQMVFIVLLTVVVLLSLTRIGLLSSAASNYLSLIAILIGGGVWVYRWYYTTRIRDRQFWSRRYFEEDGTKNTTSGCPTTCPSG